MSIWLLAHRKFLNLAKMSARVIVLFVLLLVISHSSMAQRHVWTKAAGAIGSDVSWAVSTDRWGNVYSTGHFNGTVDFDPGAGVMSLRYQAVREVLYLP